MKINLTPEEIQLLIDALDSHEYWQLAEEGDRESGYSLTEDGENSEIDACRALTRKLEEARRDG